VVAMLRRELTERDAALQMHGDQHAHEVAYLEANLQLTKLELEQRDQAIARLQQQIEELQARLEQAHDEQACSSPRHP